jgi:hypothetical protein
VIQRRGTPIAQDRRHEAQAKRALSHVESANGMMVADDSIVRPRNACIIALAVDAAKKACKLWCIPNSFPQT